MKPWPRLLIFIFFLVSVSGCSSLIVNSALQPTLTNLQKQGDLGLVCDGAPAFLLMLDSLLVNDSDNVALLTAGVQSYVGYAASLAACNRIERSAEVSAKAKQYGLLLLKQLGEFPDNAGSSSDFQTFLSNVAGSDVPSLFWGGYGWAAWIQYQQGSPASMAEIIRVEKIMLRVLELDPSFYYGAAHIFLGAYYGSRPSLLGGKLEESKMHFEQALAISDRQFLLAQVTYAETYARMTFDRTLFATLLQEVLDYPQVNNSDQALANQVAKSKARTLLESIDSYF
jgi:hypothetical protein